MPFGIGEGIGLAGMAANFATGRSAQRASKENLRRQEQYQQAANETYRAAQPGYLAGLQQMAGRAGIADQSGVVSHGQGHFSLGQQGGDDRRQFGLGGNYGSREDQLRFQAAQEDINRLARLRGNQLQSTMHNRGIADSSQAAALAGNERAAMADLTGFRRNLAINAGQEQERRLQQYMAALGPAFGQGAQAAQIAGQQGQYYGQQANQAYAGVGQIVQDWQQRNALQDYMQRYGVNTGGGGLQPGDTYAPSQTPYAFGPTLNAPMGGQPGPYAGGYVTQRPFFPYAEGYDPTQEY